MIHLTSSLLHAIYPHSTAFNRSRYVEPLNAGMAAHGIDTPLRQAHFLSQIGHESGELRTVEENLRYTSAEQLKKVFRVFRDGLFDPQRYTQNPAKLANLVYANRNGNGPPSSGDGWRYRGRGLLQVTGRTGYTQAAAALGIDCVTYPELLAEPVHACAVSCWWWESHGLNDLADQDDEIAICRRINGGLNGLEDRKRLLVLAKKALIISL